MDEKGKEFITEYRPGGRTEGDCVEQQAGDDDLQGSVIIQGQ